MDYLEKMTQTSPFTTREQDEQKERDWANMPSGGNFTPNGGSSTDSNNNRQNKD